MNYEENANIYERCLPNQIITRSLDSIEREVNISGLAKTIDKAVPSVWNKLANRRIWDADTWLRVLWSLGIARYEKDFQGKGTIVIRCDLETPEVNRLNATVTDEYFTLRR